MRTHKNGEGVLLYAKNDMNCNCNVGGKCARQQRSYGTIGIIGLGSRDG